MLCISVIIVNTVHDYDGTILESRSTDFDRQPPLLLKEETPMKIAPKTCMIVNKYTIMSLDRVRIKD
jgi:hypothetical protein